MVWDYAEANPFSESTGNFQGAINWIAEVIEESSVVLQVSPSNTMLYQVINDLNQSTYFY